VTLQTNAGAIYETFIATLKSYQKEEIGIDQVKKEVSEMMQPYP